MSVTALDTSSWTAAERQAAARDAYRASGYRLSGAELGRQFGRSGRWGRAQIQAVADRGAHAAADNGGRSHPPAGPTVAARGSVGTQRQPSRIHRRLRSRSDDGSRRRCRWACGRALGMVGAVVAVAFVAAVASYAHMFDLARHAGEGWLAWLLPVSVDGLVVAGSTTMVVRRRKGHGGGWLAWVAVGLGIGASLAANVVAADPSLVDPEVVRRVIAGWPPVALAISAELALQLRSASSEGSGRGTISPTSTRRVERHSLLGERWQAVRRVGSKGANT